MNVAESLRAHGYAAAPAVDFIAEHRLQTLAELGQRMYQSAECQQAQAEFLAGTSMRRKPFLYSHRPWDARGGANPLDDELGAIGAKRLLVAPLVEYLGTTSIEYHASDLVVNLAGARRFPRMQSHRWHRDPEAGAVVKIFLFMHDVAAENGPFEYVEGSHLDLFDLCPARIYPKRNIDDELPAERVRTFTCPEMTLVFADTRGLHRGAYTGVWPRVNAVWTYLGP